MWCDVFTFPWTQSFSAPKFPYFERLSWGYYKVWPAAFLTAPLCLITGPCSLISSCARRACEVTWSSSSLPLSQSGFFGFLALLAAAFERSKESRGVFIWWPSSVAMHRAFSVFRGYRRAGEDDDDVFVSSPGSKVTDTTHRNGIMSAVIRLYLLSSSGCSAYVRPI